MNASRPRWLWLALCAMGCALSVPPLRSLIEQSMLWHMAVQMPLLVTAGWTCVAQRHTEPAHSCRSLFGAFNAYGLTGLLASQVILAYWMLPLAIDRAVLLPSHDALKIASLLGCGALLKGAWVRSPPAVQLFFVGSLASMLTTSGVILASSELRLCNAYSLDTQWSAGSAMVAWAAGIACGWACAVLRISPASIDFAVCGCGVRGRRLQRAEQGGAPVNGGAPLQAGVAVAQLQHRKPGRIREHGRAAR